MAEEETMQEFGSEVNLQSHPIKSKARGAGY